jgi:hypothetical protein
MESDSTDSLTLIIQIKTNQQMIILRQQEIPSKNTDAIIDASCNRTHYGSNWVVCVGKNQLNTFN